MSGNGNYKASGGTNGIGASMVNALSKTFRAIVYRNDKKHSITWDDGIKKAEMSISASDKPAKHTGTIISFVPSLKYFNETDTVVIPYEKMKQIIQDRAFLNDGLSITLVYDGQAPEKFKYTNGMAAFHASIVSGMKTKLIPKSTVITYDAEKEITQRDGKPGFMAVRIALGFTSKTETEIRTLTNMIEQREGGTHLQGFKMGIGRPFLTFLNDPDNKSRYLKGKYKSVEPAASDIFPGLVAIIATVHTDPIYSGQDKNKLKSTDMQGFLQTSINNAINTWLQTADRIQIDAVINHVLRNAYLRKSSESAIVRVNKEEQKFLELGRAEKLADCTGRENTELIFVEGDSAAGSAKTGRDRQFQAIMPISGKIPNVFEESSPLKSAKTKEVLSATGMDITGKIDPLTSLKYDRIILLPDADSDGQHIACLLLTLFHKVGPSIIEAGRLYIAIPPLFRITGNNSYVHYCVDQEELNTYLSTRAFKTYSESKNTFIDIAGKKLTNKQIYKIMRLDKHFKTLQDEITRSMLDKSCIYSFITHLANFDLMNDDKLNIIEMFIDFVHDENPKFFSDLGNGLYKGVVDGKVCFFNTNQITSVLQYTTKLVKGLIKADISIAYTNSNAKRISIAEVVTMLDAWANHSINVAYLKGLGEMTPKQLRETTLDFNTRRLYQVSMADIDKVSNSIADFMSNSAPCVRFRAGKMIELYGEKG